MNFKRIAGSFVAVMASTMMVGGSMMAFAHNSNGQLGFSSSETGVVAGPYNDGQVVYITLENPGGQEGNTNYKSIPPSLTFSFKGSSDSEHGTDATGTLVSGTNTPLVYKVNVPADLVTGKYTVSTQFSMANGSKGEDTFSWSGTSDFQTIPAGQLPEFPYAGLAPVLLLGAIGVGMIVRKRRAQA